LVENFENLEKWMSYAFRNECKQGREMVIWWGAKICHMMNKQIPGYKNTNFVQQVEKPWSCLSELTLNCCATVSLEFVT
jgi:hypothetical protein